ncbi:threonine dehydratase [Candidatus Poribacteria bacterium]|nr:threonine dehydratase [Candidatus Poribacteria bacterium]
MKSMTLQEIIAARPVVSQYLKPTPLVHYPELSERLGFQAYIKHENHHPTGSFKVRGGINFMHHLPQAQREKGVLTATRGNHGQSIAYAAAQYGVKATVVVPHGNNPEKNSAMQAFGAELIEHGADFDEALALCETLQAERGLYYVHPCMEPALFHGVGTYSLEIFESLPDVDAIIVPIGGGSGCCGAITVSKAINPNVKIIGVQAENAPAIYRSWKTGTRVETDSCDTIADGIATRSPFPLPLSIIKKGIHDIVLLSEVELEEGIRLALRWTHNLAEGAGASPIAAAHKLTDTLAGKRVVMVMSGANLDTETLKRVLSYQL